MIPPDFVTTLDRLCQPVRKGEYQPTLAPVQALLRAVGTPQEHFGAVVVAGSTGKGTTCHQIAQRLRSYGLNIGLYLSPHLHSFRERFNCNGELISHADFVRGANTIFSAAAHLPHRYSTIEQATALALWWFSQKQVDIAVLEVGLGGRWDAVNVVDNLLAVLTPVEMEHAAMLGGSLESIADHKAGIIQPEGHAITLPQSPPVMKVIRRECAVKNARLHIAESQQVLLEKVEQHLQTNGHIPGSTTPTVTPEFTPLPGRLEWIDAGEKKVLIDGGHTPAAAQHLLEEIERTTPTGKVRLVVGLLNDKNASGYLTPFDISRFHIVLTTAPGHRAASPHDIRTRVSMTQATVSIIETPAEALTPDVPEALVVIAGSLRMAAAARERYGLLSAGALEEARITRSIFEGPAYLAKLSPTSQTGSSTPE